MREHRAPRIRNVTTRYSSTGLMGVSASKGTAVREKNAAPSVGSLRTDVMILNVPKMQSVIRATVTVRLLNVQMDRITL